MPPFPPLRDIAPPVEPGDPTMVIVWSVFGAIVAAAAAIALLWWLRARARRAKLPPLPLTAATVAMRKLGDLASLAPTLLPADLGAQVSEVVRTYLHRARGVLANYRTTDELLGGKNDASGPPPLPFFKLEPVLQRCDSLKYGGAFSTPAERTALVEEALAAVQKDGTEVLVREPEDGMAQKDEAAMAENAVVAPEPPAVDTREPAQNVPQPVDESVAPAPRPFRTAWEIAQEKAFSSKTPVVIRKPKTEDASQAAIAGGDIGLGAAPGAENPDSQS